MAAILLFLVRGICLHIKRTRFPKEGEKFHCLGTVTSMNRVGSQLVIFVKIPKRASFLKTRDL